MNVGSAASGVIAVKNAGCGTPAEIAIDASVIDVEGSGDIQDMFLIGIRHGKTMIRVPFSIQCINAIH